MSGENQFKDHLIRLAVSQMCREAGNHIASANATNRKHDLLQVCALIARLPWRCQGLTNNQTRLTDGRGRFVFDLDFDFFDLDGGATGGGSSYARTGFKYGFDDDDDDDDDFDASVASCFDCVENDLDVFCSFRRWPVEIDMRAKRDRDTRHVPADDDDVDNDGCLMVALSLCRAPHFGQFIRVALDGSSRPSSAKLHLL